MDRRTHDRLPLLSSSDVTKSSIRLLQSLATTHWTIVHVDGLATRQSWPITVVLNCRQDRVGVQTFAERNKISFCRYGSRTGALTGTELLGNCRGQKIHGQYASHRKWPIGLPQSPHSYPRAADLSVTPHTQPRTRSATSDTHQPPRLKKRRALLRCAFLRGHG